MENSWQKQWGNEQQQQGSEPNNNAHYDWEFLATTKRKQKQKYSYHNEKKTAKLQQ